MSRPGRTSAGCHGFSSRWRPFARLLQTRGRERRSKAGMTMSVRDKVIAIIAEQAVLDVAEVKPEMTLEDLGIDSLGLVESIFAIEGAFDISVPFNANEPEKSGFDMSSVGAVIRAVEDLVAQAA